MERSRQALLGMSHSFVEHSRDPRKNPSTSHLKPNTPSCGALSPPQLRLRVSGRVPLHPVIRPGTSVLGKLLSVSSDGGGQGGICNVKRVQSAEGRL